MKKQLGKIIAVICLLFVSVILVLPIVFMVHKAALGDFYLLLIEKFWFYPKFWNSLLYAAGIGAGASFLSLLTAFGLTKGEFRYGKAVSFLLLLLMLMPLQTTLLPNYIGLRDLGLLDTRRALILPMICSPFAIYLMCRYMEGMPDENWEAARLETGSLFQILFHVVFPQMRACVAAVFVFMFAEGFNMIEQPMYYVKQDKLKPLSIITDSMQAGEEKLIYAIGIVCMIPLLFLYGFYEEELADGLGMLKM